MPLAEDTPTGTSTNMQCASHTNLTRTQALWQQYTIFATAAAAAAAAASDSAVVLPLLPLLPLLLLLLLLL
jgi:hypothetical protein